MKVSYADYENKTSEALADTMDCSVHKKPVIHYDNNDGNQNGHEDDDDEKDVDDDNDNGHEYDDLENDEDGDIDV